MGTVNPQPSEFAERKWRGKGGPGAPASTPQEKGDQWGTLLGSVDLRVRPRRRYTVSDGRWVAGAAGGAFRDAECAPGGGGGGGASLPGSLRLAQAGGGGEGSHRFTACLPLVQQQRGSVWVASETEAMTPFRRPPNMDPGHVNPFIKTKIEKY